MEKPNIGLHPLRKVKIQELNNSEELCIWCRKKKLKNTAHIIMKNLLLSEHSNNKLKYSVCKECNTFWGSTIEDWFLKYTPLGEWKENILKIKHKKKNNTLSNYKYVPNFIYNGYYSVWLVVNNSLKGMPFPFQIILNKENKFSFFIAKQSQRKDFENLYLEFKNAISHSNFTVYISKILDDDISPRLFKLEEKFILIAKNTAEKDEFILKFLNSSVNDIENIIKSNIIGSIDDMQIHYKWSLKRYLSLSSKIAFEFLSLIKGAEFILNKDFDNLRNSLISPKTNFDNLSILYVQGKGYAVKRLNYPFWITLDDNFDNTQLIDIPTLIFENEDEFTFKIIIYKYKNLICATVKLFEIEHSKIVLAKTNLPFDKVYGISYKLKNDEFFIYESSDSIDIYDERILVPFYKNEELENFN